MLAVPPAVLEMLRLQAGASVDVTVENGRLLVEPRRQKRYSLKELLAQCNVNASSSAEDKGWTSSAPAGDELI